MSTTAAGTAISGLASALGNLAPGSLLKLGHHLSASGAAQALQLLNSAKSNPSAAAVFISQLNNISGLNPQVTTWANDAAALAMNPAQQGQFMSFIDQAIAAVQEELASENALQQAGLF